MRYLLGFLCVGAFALLLGCSAGEAGNLCGGIDDVYDCIDEPLCTPTLTPYNCLNVSQEECAKNLERPADCPGFCHEYDGLYFWDCVIFCEESADCREGFECVLILDSLMRRGECSMACVDECQQDADCPEGQSCIVDIACGGCSFIANVCWDEMAAYCS